MKTFLIGLGFVSIVGAALLLGWPVTHAETPSPSPVAGQPLRLWSAEAKGYVTVPRIEKTDAAWKAALPALSYQVVRQGGTERAYTGRYWDEHGKGLYRCVACNTDLFRSETKFESGTGWPSFFQPIAAENIETRVDRSLFMERIEVLCRRCGAHLGHVFSDGPEPTGLRYCMNSAALTFVPDHP